MKFGIGQWHKPAPKKVQVFIEMISYTLAGVAGFSFMQDNTVTSTILLFVAGGIDKFAPRLFGEDSEVQP